MVWVRYVKMVVYFLFSQLKFSYLKNVAKVWRDRRENDFMSLKLRSIGTSQGNINKVMPWMEVTEGGGHVYREVVPFEAVLLCAAHVGSFKTPWWGFESRWATSLGCRFFFRVLEQCWWQLTGLWKGVFQLVSLFWLAAGNKKNIHEICNEKSMWLMLLSETYYARGVVRNFNQWVQNAK